MWQGVSREKPMTLNVGAEPNYKAKATPPLDGEGRETSLRASELRYRRLFEAAHDGVLLLDAATQKITDANPFMSELLGYTHKELLGQELWEIGLLKDVEASQDAFDKLKKTGQVRYENLPLQAKTGQKREVEFVSNLYDEDGTQVIQCNIRDITERKRAQDELKAAKIRAESAMAVAQEANAAKDHFLAVLGHELRNPLNPVLAIATMLHDKVCLDADTREQLAVICRNAELAARLIDDLLDMTRIKRGKVGLDRHRIDLCTVIRRAEDDCRSDFEVRKLEFDLDVGPGPYWVDADAGRLQEVFWNLLNNAVKFTPVAGSIRVRCWPDSAGFVIAEVRDNGEGIDPSVIGGIFNAFDQGERSITRQFGGLGLGLSISKALVEMHGGTIHAQSPGKGRGATFAVRLPLMPSEAAVPAASAPSVPSTSPPMALAGPLRILLVEDHGDTAVIMHRLLSAQGHKVQVAGDLAMALKLAAEHPFDLLLSDLGLPDGSGLDLMRTLRARGLTLPGIALSGYGQETDLQASRAAGFAAHLIKPLKMPRLTDAIADVVADSRGGRS
jgi:two-component system, chemotaxis family, CheB/CheR fusion protein